jgi:AcrR family transcriptional regulator
MVSPPSPHYAIQWCIAKESTSTGTVVKTLTEQHRSTNSRGYRKTKRAQDEQRTRARIVDAAEELHGTIGPARTSVSAVAESAGVTRATVYRHFPDDESLFLACSGQWLARQRLPDPQAWPVGAKPGATLRAGLNDIYRYYRDGQSMLTHVLRHQDLVPERVRNARIESERRWQEALLASVPGRRRTAVRAAIAHACEFSTWRSLVVDHGLSDRAAVDLMVGMVMTAATPLPSS